MQVRVATQQARFELTGTPGRASAGASCSTASIPAAPYTGPQRDARAGRRRRSRPGRPRIAGNARLPDRATATPSSTGGRRVASPSSTRATASSRRSSSTATASGHSAVTTANGVATSSSAASRRGEKWILTSTASTTRTTSRLPRRRGRDRLRARQDELRHGEAARRDLRRHGHRPHDHDPPRQRRDAGRLVPDPADGVHGETLGGRSRGRAARVHAGNLGRAAVVDVAAVDDDFVDGGDALVFPGFEQRVNRIRGPLVIDGGLSANAETFLNNPAAPARRDEQAGPDGHRRQPGGTPGRRRRRSATPNASHVNARVRRAPRLRPAHERLPVHGLVPRRAGRRPDARRRSVSADILSIAADRVPGRVIRANGTPITATPRRVLRHAGPDPRRRPLAQGRDRAHGPHARRRRAEGHLRPTSGKGQLTATTPFPTSVAPATSCSSRGSAPATTAGTSSRPSPG